MDVVLQAFGPDRVMFGSDWPVCNLAGDYRQWHQVVSDFISTTFSSDEQDKIMGGTAIKAYNLAVEN
jgi:L-fuconolactonase